MIPRCSSEEPAKASRTAAYAGCIRKYQPSHVAEARARSSKRQGSRRPLAGAIRPFRATPFAPSMQAQYSSGERSSAWRRLPSKFLRRFACPSSKCVPKVRRLAESEREGDVLHRHRRFAQVAQRDVNSELVGQLPKRGVVHAKLPPERTRSRPEQLSDGGE